MTEPEEKTEPGSPSLLPELEVPFTYPVDGGERTRNMWVRMPKPEQILVWQRIINRLTEAPVDATWTGSEIMLALERLRKIVDSILVNKADIEWIDDQFLDETLDFKKLAPLVTQAVAAFQQDQAENSNREGRRAATRTAKKAARKKANR